MSSGSPQAARLPDGALPALRGASGGGGDEQRVADQWSTGETFALSLVCFIGQMLTEDSCWLLLQHVVV